MAEKSLHERKKPTSLDWILTFMPIPVLGEIKAAKTTRYLVEQEQPGGPDEGDMFDRMIVARTLAYFSIPLAIGGIYLYSQI